MREWRNGILRRLKIFRRKACGFDSRLSHQMVGSIGMRRRLINSGDWSDGLERKGSNPLPTTNINIMDKKQQEILYILQEECAEVSQVVSKINRFGFANPIPLSDQTNQDRLEHELGDLLCIIHLMFKNGLLRPDKVKEAELNKLEKLRIWSQVV